jgi:hypothetical protein
MWTHYRQTTLKTAFAYANARSVHKVTDFVDRHYINEDKNLNFSVDRGVSVDLLFL